MEIKKNQFVLAVDISLFTIRNKELQVLLIKRKNLPFQNMYALPGGHVELNETAREAAVRELEEETGIQGFFLKQMLAVSTVNRDPRGRVVSIPFFALVSNDKLHPHAASDALETRWFSVYDLPKLAFDHKEIIADALKQLRYRLFHTNIARELMPDKFTLTELQQSYEIVLKEKLDKRNFRKKLKELGILKELYQTSMKGAHRPAKLHCFKHKEYLKV